MDISIDSQESSVKFENNECPDIWNNNIGRVKATVGNGIGQIIPLYCIYLKEPLYISINKLKPKPIHMLYAPRNSDQKLMPLLGLDIIEQYEYHSITFRGKKCLIIDEPINYDEWLLNDK